MAKKENLAQNVAIVTGCASMSANIICCTVTHPLDLIRTRAYFKYYNKNQDENYSGIKEAILRIYQKDGFFGYFRGLFPRILRKGAGTVVAWGIYEYLVEKEYALIAL